MKCQICGQETFLPFQCPYCGGLFCSNHRLPESHNCSKMELVRESKRKNTMVFSEPNSFKYQVSYGETPQSKKNIYFGYTELKHLTLGTLLVVGVGLSIGASAGQEILNMLILAAILTTSFFIHEIAHKVIAQKSGLWAEFRLTLLGSMLTVVFMMLPGPFKIISPGAVMISGPAKQDDIGKISIAGPLTNIVLSSGFLGLSFIFPFYTWIFAVGALINSYIALFNLIPFGILDGFKIFNWNKTIWSVSFVLSAVLLIISYSFY